MRLVIAVGEPWIAASAGEAEALAFERVDLSVRLHTTFLKDRFATHAVTHEDAQLSSETPARSTLGWPVVIIERVATTNGAARREIEVRYALFEFHASVVVGGPADVILRHRDELLTAALSARPDWTGEVACVSELLPEVD